MEPLVRMFRTRDSGNVPSTNPGEWVILKPSGYELQTPGSLTQGLKEGLRYAVENGYNFRADGGPVAGLSPNGRNGAIIQCQQPIELPPMQQGEIILAGVSLNFVGTQSGGPAAILTDSIMSARFAMPGSQILLGDTYSIGVHVKPRSLLPEDTLGGKVVTASEIDLPSIVSKGSNQSCAVFDAAEGAIVDNKLIRVLEANGGVRGVDFINATATTEISGNPIQVPACHAQTGTCLRLGSSNTYADRVKNNQVSAFMKPATNGSGMQLYGQYNYLVFSVDDSEGSPAMGFTVNTNALYNTILPLKVCATTKKIDVSSPSGTNTILTTQTL